MCFRCIGMAGRHWSMKKLVPLKASQEIPLLRCFLVAAQLLSQYRTSQKTMKRLMCVLFVVTPLVILSNNETKSLKIDEDRSCPPNHGCVVKQGCPAIQTLYEKKDSPRSSTREKSLALNELRSLICNYKKKGFCCKPDFKNGMFL